MISRFLWQISKLTIFFLGGEGLKLQKRLIRDFRWHIMEPCNVMSCPIKDKCYPREVLDLFRAKTNSTENHIAVFFPK